MQDLRILAWRISPERLPTLVVLARRNIWTGQVLCRICGQHEEDEDHLFVSCEVAQHMWNFLKTYWIGGSRKWRKLIYAVMQVTLWVLWRSRNDLVFNDKQIILDRMMNEVKQMGFLWIGSRSTLKEITWEEWCNFDVSSKC
ncbi:putative reverse transcriptase zinc-binding domain-containing protein [Helianthus anomalus]